MTEDRPPATPGPAQTTTTDDLDALDRKAALLTGWKRIPQFPSLPGAIGMGSHYWVDPNGRKLGGNSHPKPTRDPGDCMRLLLHTLAQDPIRKAILIDTLDALDVTIVSETSRHWRDAAPLVAITRACLAALEAVAGGEREGEAGAK